jgi:hypothetical protein
LRSLRGPFCKLVIRLSISFRRGVARNAIRAWFEALWTILGAGAGRRPSSMLIATFGNVMRVRRLFLKSPTRLATEF